MPVTGKELNVDDITELDANVHAGVKFVRTMVDRYYAKEPMDVTYLLIQGEYMQRQAIRKDR